MRMLSSYSVCTTTMSLPLMDIPMVINLSSLFEWAGSSIVIDKGSPKTVDASSNDIPCFLLFALAFLSFH